MDEFNLESEAFPPGDQPSPTQSTGESLPFQPLDVNFTVAERVSGLISMGIVAILAIVSLIGFWFFRGFDWISWTIAGTSLMLIVVLAVASMYWPHLYYRHASWKLDEESLEIHKGVLWKRQISVPLGRVQHADVAQGPLQRRFGLGKLIVHTAGSYQASVELDGLNHEVALRLRDRLIRQAHQLTESS